MRRQNHVGQAYQCRMHLRLSLEDVDTRPAEVAALSGDLNYADWQREYLSLTSEE